jgi:hypothetical protein
MRELSGEFLIYVLIFIGIMAFNYFLQQSARRRRQEEQAQEQAQQEALQQEGGPASDEPLPDVWGRKPSAPDEELPEVWKRKPSAQDEALPDFWGRKAPASVARAVPAMSAERGHRTGAPAFVQPPRRAPSGALFGSRRDLRRAIVLMTVLGPCRAEDPPAERR